MITPDAINAVARAIYMTPPAYIGAPAWEKTSEAMRAWWRLQAANAIEAYERHKAATLPGPLTEQSKVA